MHQNNIEPWQHDHTFHQDQKRSGEKRTLLVAVITAMMMIVEIIAGIVFGSMALLADGLHMASHTVALSINVFAYVYARRHAKNRQFTFGTGKVNALGGFTGAVLLGMFAIVMAWESVKRFIHPVSIAFDQAILVATIGLVVNGVSIFILDSKHDHDHSDEENISHDHHGDHNLRSAYFHVLADALTSLLAIFALLAGKYFAFTWMDPLMGIVGAILVSRWSLGLLRTSSGILLDKQAPVLIQKEIKKCIESDGDSQVTDLHLWAIGPHIYSAIISIVAHHPKELEEYKKSIPSHLGLAHVTIEICKCREGGFSIVT